MEIRKIYNLIKYYIISRKYPKITQELINERFKEEFWYGDKRILNAENTNNLIYNSIISEKPFMAGRYGSAELFMLIADDFNLRRRYDKYLNILCQNAGFFPGEKKYAHKFAELMLESSEECDVFACWYNMYEEYYMKNIMRKETQGTFLFNFEPWSYPEQPWTAALKGKKVLVIHPFTETIHSQYKNRKKIWGKYEILPEFELKTLKAVQTIAGEVDERFATWFDALEWMYDEALKIDFEIAIIGCGAYGFPLASKLKKAGKQAIHLGGVTQILFGIKGKRWEEDPAYEYIRSYFNEHWVSPSQNEIPANSKKIENGCYW